MKLLILGATGQTGSALVELALEEGYQVTAFVRDPARLNIAHENLTVFQGDAANSEDIVAALPHHGVVLSALGARTLDPNPAYVQAAATVIQGMEIVTIAKLVYCLSAGSFFEENDPPYQHVINQHKQVIGLLQDSLLNWVGVCPPNITNEPRTGSVHVEVGGPPPRWTISRYDLAAFMLAQVENDDNVGQLVSVCN